MNHFGSVLDRRGFLRGMVALGGGVLVVRTATPAMGATPQRSRVTTAMRSVGKLDVICLLDAEGPFTLASPEVAFPDATEDDWAAARRLDPDAFGADGSWHLHFQCFLIHGRGGRVMLIDTGVGPPGSPASSWAPVPGRLPEALAHIGIDVRDVDLVVHTHLHSDHLGWSVTTDGVAVFPQARYVVQRDEVAALEAAGSALVPFLIRPLRGSGQLHEIGGLTRLSGRRNDHHVTAVPTPGHTPGHQSVLVTDRHEEIIVTGDALVHAVQLANPDISYVFEASQDTARTSRLDLLARARRRNALLATAHLNQPFVRVPL